MSQHSRLNARAEELGLWNRPRSEVRSQLIELFRPIALKTAEVFASKYRRSDLDECESEADLALVRAVDAYDPTRGAQFATYLQYAVNKAMSNVDRVQDWVSPRVRAKEKKQEVPSEGLLSVVPLAQECQIAHHDQSQEHANHCEMLDEIFSKAPEHVARIAREMIEENHDMQALARRWSVSDALAYAIVRETRQTLAVAASAC